MARLKPLLTTLAVTGALVGGGAAIASAATSTSTTSTTSGTPSTGTTGGSGSTAPAHAAHPGSGTANGGSHNCPNM